MNWIKRIALILIVLSSFRISGQQEELTSNFEDLSYITFDVTAPLDPQVPRWRLGYLRTIKKEIKTRLGFGLGLDDISIKTPIKTRRKENYRLWEIRNEWYYVFNPDQGKRNTNYLSVELFYINHKDTFYDNSYEPSEGNISVSYDRADLFRYKYGAIAKFGYFFEWRRRVIVNLFGGIGYRIKENKYSNVVNPVESDARVVKHWDSVSFVEREGKKDGVELSLGLKLILNISKRKTTNNTNL
ncbi:hypothetical protein ABW636_08405 [Aquimarina sp. 2201CG1-2-11]|uniref:hypothetical protein n=1 Tax=Aquimarina discodermiae TaxID=3231043 RepID=UPI00346231CB